MREGSMMSFFVHPKPFADREHSLNPKCVDEMFLALDDSSVTV